MADSNHTLRITNKAREGYRRAGVPFAKGINDVAASAFTKDQLAAIEADPRLQLEVLDDTAATETGETQGPVADGGVDAGVTKTPAPVTDEKPDAIPEALVEGFNKLKALEASGELELNSSGKPNADVLDVTAAQRDQIWSLIQAQKEKGTE